MGAEQEERKRTILVIEDDSLMLNVFDRLLRLSGLEVLQAEKGDVALEMLNKAKEKPALILLDVMMPKMSGFDVLKILKASPILKTIPVVMLTNVAGKEDAARAIEMGASLYLVKSEHDPEEIVRQVKRILV